MRPGGKARPAPDGITSHFLCLGSSYRSRGRGTVERWCAASIGTRGLVGDRGKEELRGRLALLRGACQEIVATSKA